VAEAQFELNGVMQIMLGANGFGTFLNFDG
jgi:hypothetical protein